MGRLANLGLLIGSEHPTQLSKCVNEEIELIGLYSSGQRIGDPVFVVLQQAVAALLLQFLEHPDQHRLLHPHLGLDPLNERRPWPPFAASSVRDSGRDAHRIRQSARWRGSSVGPA